LAPAAAQETTCLWQQEEIPLNNGAILNISQIIKLVMSLAAEAELGALYINTKTAVPMSKMLKEFGHPQPPTPMQTNNSTAYGVLNNKNYPKRNQSHWHALPLVMMPRCSRKIPFLLETRQHQLGRLLDKAPPSKVPQNLQTRNSDVADVHHGHQKGHRSCCLKL
jgi:hypothetical protein